MGNMENWAIIGTWRMAYEGICEASKLLSESADSGSAIELAIKMVEDYPFYKSVGYGGLPNEEGVVELDAAYMDGKTLGVGCVAAITDFSNPISIAKKLSKDRFNIFLVGDGAKKYANKEGFIQKNMLTERAKKIYEIRREEIKQNGLNPYDGHDTVGMIALDKNGHMSVGTSTSGLFYKKSGRVGDSPIIGSGYYVDEMFGGASCTGLGEDIMKGCLSYEAVRRLSEGKTPLEIAQPLVDEFVGKLVKRQGKAGAMSIIVLDNKGNWAIGTNVEFTYVVATNQDKPTIYLAKVNQEGKVSHSVATQEWLDAYTARITKPI